MDLARRFYPLPKDARLRKGAALDSCWPVCSRLLVEFAQWQAVALGRRTARDCACRALLLHDKGRLFGRPSLVDRIVPSPAPAAHSYPRPYPRVIALACNK